MSKFYPFIFKNAILPAYDLARTTSRYRFGRILDRTQWLSPKILKQLQEKNLRALIRHAYTTVPYYHRIFKERNLHPDDIQTVEDLVKLPVLTKSDIRQHFNELISTIYPRKNLVRCSSGGTGDQIRFLVTREKMSWEVAAEFRAYNWGGYQLGDKCLVFWGSPLDLAKHESLINRFTAHIERVMTVNTYIVSDDVLSKHITLINKFTPEVIRGYASSVYIIAKYILKTNAPIMNPRSIFTSAETLSRDQRETITQAFNCPVFDYYGSREIGAIAAECEEHAGYHISAENVVLECIRDDEQAVGGERGVVVLTSLRNLGMPFLRYAIGDVCKASNETCSCGRGLPIIEAIEGRISQFMAIYDKQSGKIVPMSTAAPGPISMALMQVPVESYRIIQESLDRIVIKLVKGKGYSEKHTAFVIKKLRDIIGGSVKIEFEFLPYIESLPSGKRSVFISKINSFQKVDEAQNSRRG